MRHAIPLVAALLLAGIAASSARQEKPKEPQATPGEFKVPPDEAKRTNPAKATAASLAEARRFYGYDCAMCHGKDGDGKGDLAEQIKLHIPTLLNPATPQKKTNRDLL